MDMVVTACNRRRWYWQMCCWWRQMCSRRKGNCVSDSCIHL